MNKNTNTNSRKSLVVATAILVVAAVSAQEFVLDQFTLDSGGGTSAGGVFALSGTLSQLEATPMSGATFSIAGDFVSLIGVAPPVSTPTTLFDNSGGNSTGFEYATARTWLANKFCLGPHSYTLGLVTLSLTSRDLNNPVAVRLHIYADDPLTGLPSGPTEAMMNLFAETNPITFSAVGGSAERLVQWTPATPFTLSANRCYWAVFSVESGEVMHATTFTMANGEAGAFGRSASTDGGATWQTPDNTSNRKMLIRGTASATPEALVLSAVSVSAGELRVSVPGSAGQRYVIESRADLAAGAWAEIPGTAVTSSGAALQLTLPISLAQPGRFFRVKQLAP